MSGTVVLYVTRTGNSKALAEAAAARLGAKAREIVDLVPRKGFFGFMKSGMQASKGISTPIRDPEVDLSAASAVLLVQPVWASAVCPPLRTWLKAHGAELAGKKLALIASNKGSEGAPLRAKFEAEFGQLAAFECVQERQPPAEKDAALDRLATALGARS